MTILLNRRISTPIHLAKPTAKLQTENKTTCNGDCYEKPTNFQLSSWGEYLKEWRSICLSQKIFVAISVLCQERNLPPLPMNIATIPVFPIEFQRTASGEQVLLFDSGAGAADRIIAYAPVQAGQVLVQLKNWYGGLFRGILPATHLSRAAQQQNLSMHLCSLIRSN